MPLLSTEKLPAVNESVSTCRCPPLCFNHIGLTLRRHRWSAPDVGVFDGRSWRILLQKSAVTDDVVRPFHLGAAGFGPDPDALYATLHYAVHRA